MNATPEGRACAQVMQLCDLPMDILAVVLKWCFSRHEDKAQELKLNLPLLTVCRLWRHLAIPVVYRLVFVQYGDVTTCLGNSRKHTRNVGEPSNVAVATNLDLVAMVGCASAVKCVRIDVHVLANPSPVWQHVIKRMRAVASKWRVMEIAVVMHPKFYVTADTNTDTDECHNDIPKICDELVALMPDVRRLVCEGVNYHTARSLYGYLAGKYADQLQRLDSIHPITVPPDQRFTRLRDVWMSYDDIADYRLPCMESEELVNMTLKSAPANNSWASFSADSNSQVIEFSKLKTLHLSCDTVYRLNGIAARHRDGHPWELRFPSLKTLVIRSTQPICPLLQYAVLPSGMDSIAIEMNAAVYRGVNDILIPEPKCLLLCVAEVSEDDIRLLPVNRLLNRSLGSDTLKLTIKDNWLPVVPESIACTALTHLEISGPTSTDTMLTFIKRMPRLLDLRLTCLDMSDIQADISIPEAYEDAIVEPLSTSLMVLTVNHNWQWRSSDLPVSVAKHVLLRIPTLTKLSSLHIPGRLVREFVEVYAPRYPHLSGVEQELSEYERNSSDSSDSSDVLEWDIDDSDSDSHDTE